LSIKLFKIYFLSKGIEGFVPSRRYV